MDKTEEVFERQVHKEGLYLREYTNIEHLYKAKTFV